MNFPDYELHYQPTRDIATEVPDHIETAFVDEEPTKHKGHGPK